jgi:hypothetical protein
MAFNSAFRVLNQDFAGFNLKKERSLLSIEVAVQSMLKARTVHLDIPSKEAL